MASTSLSHGYFYFLLTLFILIEVCDKARAENGALSVCIMLRKDATCNFTVNAHSVAAVTGYSLNFGDSSLAVTPAGIGSISQHAYANVGEYSVVLTMLGPGITVTKKVTVREAIVNATILMSSFMCSVGEKISFGNVITPSITVQSYWKLGSSNWTVGNQITCATSGNYSLAIFVENGISAVLFKCLLNVTVVTLDLTWFPPIAATNQPVLFTPTSDVLGLSFTLVFPGSVTINCTNASMSFVFNTKNEDPGHSVTLIATDKRDSTAKISKNVTVLDPLVPPLDVKGPAFAGINMPAEYSVSVDGFNISFTWDFADGSPTFNTTLKSASHSFSQQGKYAVNVIAKNPISAISKTVYITIIEIIQGLSCAEDVIATALGQPSYLGWVVENGTEFSVKFQINPSLPTFLITNATAQDIFVFCKQHNYTAIGEYSVAVAVWNYVSNVSAKCIVVVQDPITYLDFKVTSATAYMEMNSDLTVEVTLNGTRPVIQYDFGDSTGYNSSSQKVVKKYTMYGTFNITITARNNVSTKALVKTIYIPKPVLRLTTLFAQTNYVNLTDNTTVVMRIGQGSDFRCSISYGNTVVRHYCYNLTFFADRVSLDTKPFENLVLVENYAYPKEGFYYITIFCYNRISNVSVVTTAQVLKSISGFNGTGKPPQIFGTNIGIPFTLTTGTNVTVEYFIDGVTSGSVVKTDSGGSFVMTYLTNYKSVGHYSITMRANNLVSEFNTTLYTLTIQDAITELACNVSSLSPFAKHGLPPRCRNGSNTFAAEYPIVLPAMPNKGTNLSCYYTLDDGRTVNTTNLTVQHQYNVTHKQYKPTVTCYNLVSSVSCCFPLTMEKTVTALTVTNDGPKKFNNVMSFTLNIGDYGTGTCFAWDWMDGTPVHVHGQAHCKELTFSQGQHYFATAEGATIINTQHAYEKVGEYFVNINATNNVSCIALKNQAVSVLKECHYPNVTMRDVEDNMTAAPQNYRSETKQFTNDVGVYCEVSRRTNYTWKVSLAKTSQNETIDPPELMVLPNVKVYSPVLTLPSRSLHYGCYELSVMVYMADTIGVRTIKKGYMCITCTPYIIANIKGGCLLRRILGHVIALDGRTSRDPDHELGDTRNMTFFWFCSKRNESALSLRNETALFLADPQSVPLIEIPDKNTDPTTLTRGGCYGTGAGRLPFNASLIDIDTSRAGMETGENNSLVISLVVVKNDTCGVRFGEFHQFIELTEGPVPILSTVCVQNCLPKVNINDKIAYQTNCTNCNTDTTFLWRVDKLKSCSGNPIDPANKQRVSDANVTEMMYGDSKSLHMAIKNNVLEGEVCYTCTLRATNKDGKFGENAFTIRTNSPPSNGTLHVNPRNGTSLNTTFFAYFNGWTDSDIPLTYTCGYVDGPNFKLLVKSSVTALGIKLPAGKPADDYDVKILCRVTDRAGCARTLETKVKVHPVNETGINLLDLLNYTVSDDGGPLMTAVQQGDVAGIFQLTQAISAALADQYSWAQEAADQNLTESQKQNLEELNEYRTKIRQNVMMVLTGVDLATLSDANMMACAIGDLTLGYRDLNDASQEYAVMTMDNVVKQITMVTPEDTSYTDIFETTSAAMGSLSQVALSSALAATFNSSDSVFNVTGLTSNPNKTGLMSTTERAKERVLLLMSAIDSVGTIILAFLQPGEPPIVLVSETMNTSVAKGLYIDLGKMTIGDGIQFPSIADMGLTIKDPTKDFANILSTSTKGCLFSWSNTSSQVKSQQVNIGMSDASGQPLNTSFFKDDATIIIPRDSSKIPPIDDRFMRTYKENEDSIEYMQFHAFNMTSPEMANHVQIFPRNDTHQFNVYLQYGERAYPEEGKFLFNWTVPDYSSCTMTYVNKSRTIVDGDVTHEVYVIEPNRDCKVDPHTVFVPFDLVNKTGMVYISVVCILANPPKPTDPTPDRKRRAIPAYRGGGHGRMKRSCVFIPPPPPTPPTKPPWGALRLSGTRAPNLDFMGRPIDMNTTVKYDVRIYQTNCIFYDKNTDTWNNRGCKVGNETRENRVQCKCNHFTGFGSDFFVAPNPIDFDKVFSADLSKNPVVLSVVCGLFGIYLICVVFARRADKNDEKKTGVTPLPANAAPGSHSYLISIHTGVRYNAGTTANVYIVLSGEEGESPPVLLTDPDRPLFTRGADNSLVMTIPRDVGKLSHVWLWHDNTGTSPSWYLSRILLEDLHDHQKAYFVCERWLAVEEDDGRVDRIIPVASEKELIQFNHLFVSKTVRELGDGHLWFSIIARPPQSVFTRVQRLSCALSLLYCTMITSCMFYNTGGQGEDATYIFYLGSVKIDLKQMIIGLQSSLIVFPVNLALMQIFRKIRPDESPKSTETAEDAVDFENISTCSDEEERGEKIEEEKNRKKEKKKGLHRGWRYVAWVICALSTCASATFTVFYSLSWGPVIANKWLTAFVLSFFQSVLLIQPIKVIFAAIVFALIIRKPIENEEENQDEVPDCVKTNDKSMMSEDFMFSDGTCVGPPDELLLMAARKKRLKEIRMQIILREIFAYFIFMAVLLLVSYGNRDPNAYLLRKSLYDSFITPSVDNKISFDSAGDVDSFWHWARETLIPTLYPGRLYNNKNDKNKGFIDDRYNYLVGISRLRQERIRPNTCSIVSLFKDVFHACYGAFSMSNAEKSDFDIGWKFLNKSKNVARRKRRSVQEQFSFVKETDQLVEYGASNDVTLRKRRAIDPVYVSTSGRQARKRVRGESKTYVVLESAVLADGSIMSCPTRWQYHGFMDLRGFPYWGKLNFYGGGGYPADLGYDYSTAMTVIADVNSHTWLDTQTRAVFIEFTVYSANTNLFASAFLFMEFLPNGGAFPTASFMVSRLYNYVGPYAKLIMAMEIFMLLFMMYFMYREFKLMYKQGKAYFHGFWNWIEVVLIVLEFVMLVLFLGRVWETDKNLIKMHHNPKDFVSFQYATAADQSLTYVSGLLVFLSTLRFLKILRFNKKMAFIGTTIGVIAKPIGLFMISFFVIFNAYCSLGVLIFGSVSDSYKSFLSASVTQMRILLGDFDYYELMESQRVLGPIYFFSYMYLIVFFLMNMFLAIINDSFSEVKDLENELSNEYEMVEFIMERLKAQMTFKKKANDGKVKTPYGIGSSVPFWEYKRRNDSISSDSEFSCTTNFKALKAKRNLQLVGKDLSNLLKRLNDMEMEDVESDEMLMKVAQAACNRNSSDSDTDSECSSRSAASENASSITTLNVELKL